MSTGVSTRLGPAAIALRGIHKTYGKNAALDGLELEVAEGEFFCLLGPSGAGKTTTLKTVAGLEAPDSGTVELDGADMDGVEPYDRGVAMCFESYALYPHRSAYDNLASPLRSPRHRLPAAEARDRIGAIAELLGISGLLDRPVGQLSNGQRQRIALGRVLVRPARAFLLDEPLSHLDAKLRQSMRAELKAIGAVQHTTTLYVTHDSVEALALGDRIGVIRDGRIVQTGTREEIWYRPYDTEVARAFGRPRINLLPGTVTDGGGFRSADGAVELPLGAEAAPGTEVLVGMRPRDLALRGDGHELIGSVYVTEVLGRAVEVTVRLGGQYVSLVAPRADATHLRPDDPVRLTVRPENLLLFEADRPGRPGRGIGKSAR
ncbi:MULTISPECIES: ABC transporter ATP-binding protein [unclassified Streptomyces]|uniref:ABC transporter ATP-binding protein n=1 Tax=unclassified Streptomyces TaxID=2593676 RepID=UPI002E80AD41|nr:ABC transporter ATP-binding protein [Streptomyces sp. NBC_00589]WTI39203.1 ABC transporter ATP-binding protein [Streptomyces sp. NBC_00775]WUB27118.1 ABC transporter ATP-binding protein [Streptomyces sp. NBC_00589]